jgi:lambda family phage portal protein
MRAQLGAQVGDRVREVQLVDTSRARMMGQAYAGASHIMKELQGWFAPSGDADSSIREIDTIRKRAYDLMRNAPIVTGAVTTHRVETIGPGLKLQARVNHRLLERQGIVIDEDAVADMEDNIESLFKMWAEDPRECDLEQTKTFADHQDLMLVSEIVAGEGLCVSVQQQRVDSPWMMRLQTVHPARLSNPDVQPAQVRLDGGIERDGAGAVIRYHFLESHPGTLKVDAPRNIWRAFNRYTRRTGRQQVFHVFRADEPGQSRGVPLLAPVIHKLKQLDRYSDAEIMAAVVGGMLSVIFSSENGEFPDYDTDDELREGAERMGIDTEKELALGYGTIMSAPDGMKPEVVNPGRPNPSFDPFVTAILRQVGVSLELPFEVLVQHFQSSYSAARAALLKAWKATVTRRARISRHFCTPIYQSWLQEAHQGGLLDLEGWNAGGQRGRIIRAAWSQCSWIGPARGSIDPVKEYNAELDLNDALIRPKEDITQLLTGEDWHDSVHKISREERLIRKLKLQAGRRSATERRIEEAADDADAADARERSTG